MPDRKEFEKLKELFLADLHAQSEYIKTISYEDVCTDKAGMQLTEIRCNSVHSSAELSRYMIKKRLKHFIEIIESRKDKILN